MIDGPDIICQEAYRKFLQKVCCVTYEDRGKAIGRRGLRSADALATQAGLLPRRRASHSRKRTDLVVEPFVFIEPGGVEGSGGRRSSERICGRLQFRWLKHELQIKHDV
jgi:hypothetical protein